MKQDNLNLSAPWAIVKEKIKEANISITDADLDYVSGKEGELLAHLAEKMSMSPGEIKSWIESISANKGKAS